MMGKTMCVLLIMIAIGLLVLLVHAESSRKIKPCTWRGRIEQHLEEIETALKKLESRENGQH